MRNTRLRLIVAGLLPAMILLFLAFSALADHGGFLYGMVGLVTDGYFEMAVDSFKMNLIIDGVHTVDRLNLINSLGARAVNYRNVDVSATMRFTAANYYRWEAEGDTGNGVCYPESRHVFHEDGLLGDSVYCTECSGNYAWYLDPDVDTAGLAVISESHCPNCRGGKKTFNLRFRLKGVPDGSTDILAILKVMVYDEIQVADTVFQDGKTDRPHITDSTFKEFVLEWYCQAERDRCGTKFVVEWPDTHPLWVDYIEFSDDDGYDLRTDQSTQNDIK